MSTDVFPQTPAQENKDAQYDGKSEDGYDGSKQPMMVVKMLNTDKAIRNALDRIEIRKSWIRTRKVQLAKQFQSTEPSEKKEALIEAKAINRSIAKLIKGEKQLKEKLPQVKNLELEELSDKSLPEMEI